MERRVILRMNGKLNKIQMRPFHAASVTAVRQCGDERKCECFSCALYLIQLISDDLTRAILELIIDTFLIFRAFHCRLLVASTSQ